MEALQTEITRIAIFTAAVELIGFLIGAWVLYLVIKAAIRDGINESRLGNDWAREVRRAEREEPKM